MAKKKLICVLIVFTAVLWSCSPEPIDLFESIEPIKPIEPIEEYTTAKLPEESEESFEITNLNTAGVTIVAGGDSNFVLQPDGALMAWGWNGNGNLGDGTNITRLLPVKIMDDVISVSADRNFIMAIKSDNTLWAWGANDWGFIGLGTNNHGGIVTPVQVMEDVIAVSVGILHTMAIKSDNSLWVWGWNESGQIGNGTISESFGRVLSGITAPIKIMDDVIGVSAGYQHSAAIKSDGSLWAWGDNSYGQLGDGAAKSYGKNPPNPDPVKIMDDVAHVSAGVWITMAIKTDGSLWAWGGGSEGQIGDGAREIRNSPVKIMEDAAYVSVGGAHVTAIKTDGSLWAWGWNRRGQIGNGAVMDAYSSYSSPVKIMDGVSAVSAGDEHTIAIKTDGSMWAWGKNDYGQIGDGTVTTYDSEWRISKNNDRSRPVKITDGVVPD